MGCSIPTKPNLLQTQVGLSGHNTTGHTGAAKSSYSNSSLLSPEEEFGFLWLKMYKLAVKFILERHSLLQYRTRIESVPCY